MSDSCSGSKSVDSLHCSLCIDYFSDPRLLSCLHVYCKSCLDSVYREEGSVLTCPSCYKVTTVQDGVSTLPKHLRIERQVSMLRLQQSGSEVECGSCEDSTKAEAYCIDCDSPICSSCVATHKKLKMLKNHSVTSLDSAKPQTAPVSCGIHTMELVKYYCSQCKCLICSECMIKHKDHKWVSIEDAAQQERDALRSKHLPKLEKSLKPVHEATDIVTDAISYCRTQKDSISSELNKTFDDIIATVASRRAKLLQEVTDTFTAKETRLQLQKESYEKQLRGLKTTIDSATSASSEYAALEILSIRGFIQNASSKVLKEIEATSYAVDSECPQFKHNFPNIEQAISSFGKLSIASEPSLCSLVKLDSSRPIGIPKDTNCRFVLQTRNRKGDELEMGGANITATIKKSSKPCEVRDCKNGQYKIDISSSKNGPSELCVSIDGVEVGGSPYLLNVIDYAHSDEDSSVFPTNGHAPQYIAIGSVTRSLYVTTNSGYVEVYDQTMKNIKTISKSKLNGNNLRGIAVDEANGIMFVSSSSNNKVIKADLNGDVLATLGGVRGSPQFQCPTGLCLTEDGLLLVGDCQNKRVVIFTSDFTFKYSIRCEAQVWGVSVDHYNQIHVGTTQGVEVFKVEPKGFVKITEYGNRNIKAGQICFPNFEYCSSSHRQCFVTNCTYNGEILLCNWTNNTIVRSFKTDQNPLGMAINQEGVLYTCCYGSKKIITHSMM